MTESTKGVFIVIEGTDSSGKATQSKILAEKLEKEEKKILKVEYPNYKSNSSAIVKMYLNGEIKEKPEEINPYAASAFYAVDRYISYEKEWKEFYNNGGIIIADRYTTSNMIHQAAKIENGEEKESYLKWLWEFEFEKMGLPIPDKVIFLNMPYEYSEKLIKNRENKITGGQEKDIHEKNEQYMKKSYENACFIAEKYGWEKIDCVFGGEIRNIEEIAEEVYQKIKNLI